MAQLIIFGGGDAGALFISSKGVRSIPPIDPNIRLQLRGLSALLNGSDPMPAREMSTLINKISNLIFAQIEGIIGPLEGDQTLIYQDEEGGFYCGSTGKPPIPFHWPPQIIPNLSDLLAAGVLEKELIDFLNEIVERKMDILQVFENPAEAATKLDMKLSERTMKDLHQFAPSQLNTVTDPINHEVIEFFHAVAKDGRYISTWATRPYEVANQLKVQLSDLAADRILNAGASAISDASGRVGAVAVVAVVGYWISIAALVIIGVVVATTRKADLSVNDASGLVKF